MYNAITVAKEMGVSKTTVLKILHKNGVRVSRIKYSDEQIINHYKKVGVLKTTCKDLSISDDYVRSILRKHNIQLINQSLNLDLTKLKSIIDDYIKTNIFVVKPSKEIIFTLYSVGEDADENSETLRNKMQSAKRADGSPVYTKATGSFRQIALPR